VPLPFSFLGEIRIPAPPEVEVVACRLEQALRILKAREVNRAGLRIEFKAGASLAVSGTNLLAPVGSGELSLQPSADHLTVRYRLRFTQLFMLSVLVPAICSPVLFYVRNLPEPQEAVLLLLVVCLSGFGINVAISIVRFPRWIVHTVVGKG
jgi:hypothetical protein